MRFQHQIAYDSPPDTVYAMLVDPSFRQRVCQALRASRHEVTVERHAGGMSVVVDHTQPSRGVPSFARKLVGEEIRIVQREQWADRSRGLLVLDIPGKPGRLDGDITLTGSPEGSLETVTGDLTVKVPIVGGRLEGLVADLLHRALEAEQRVGRAWLAGAG
jgi:hypothetical protein